MLESGARVAFFLVLFVALPILSKRTSENPLALQLPRVSLYLSTVLSQFFLFILLLLILWLESQGLASVSLVPPDSWGALLTWSAFGVLAGLAVATLIGLLQRRLGHRESDLLRRVFPRTRRERLVFALAVSPTAGIVEELLFRGYAITRLTPLVGGAWTAALITSLSFGAAHIYQGWLGASRAALLGFLLAIPVVVTGSLLPAMIAHGLIDVVAGLWLAPWLMRDKPEPQQEALRQPV